MYCLKWTIVDEWQIKYSNSSSKYIVIIVAFELLYSLCNRIAVD